MCPRICLTTLTSAPDAFAGRVKLKTWRHAALGEAENKSVPDRTAGDWLCSVRDNVSPLLPSTIPQVPTASQDIHRHVLSHLSSARAATYLAATTSATEAVKLYRWNTEASGALHEVLGVVEVVVRNAIDGQLRAWNSTRPARPGSPPYTDEWIANPARPVWDFLNPKQRGGGRHSAYQSALGRALSDRDARRASHPRAGAPVTHDDLVAHLTFGTWVSLLPRRQLNGTVGPPGNVVLWKQALCKAFPNHPNPTVIRFWLSNLRTARNRLAHVEPLLDFDLIGLNRMAIRVVRAIDTPVGDWLAGISRVAEVVKRRP